MNESHTFPSPSKAGWLFMLLIGVLLVSAGSYGLLSGKVVADTEVWPFMVAGVGLFLVGFSLLVLANREPVASYRIRDDKLVLSCRDRTEVALPLLALRAVETQEGQADAWMLVLLKRDGGRLELATFADEESAEQFAAPIRAAMPEASTGAAEPIEEPERHLGGLRRLDASRMGDRLQLTWAADAPARVLLGLLPGGGFILIALGVLRGGGVAAGFLLGLIPTVMVVAIAYLVVRRVGVTQIVTVDASELVSERHRGARRLERASVPLSEVVAVDYSHQLQQTDGMLLVRTRSEQAIHDRGMGLADRAAQRAEIGDERGAAIDALAENKRMMQRPRLQIPMGRLSLAERVAVDLMIGDEVVRRAVGENEPAARAQAAQL